MFNLSRIVGSILDIEVGWGGRDGGGEDTGLVWVGSYFRGVLFSF